MKQLFGDAKHSHEIVKKGLIKRVVFWSLALAVTLFVCHVSFRLREASLNYVAFNVGDERATFSKLVRYAAYLYVPASYESCINKLRQIDGATQQWAFEHGKKPEDKGTWNDILPYLRGRLWCPHGGIYVLGTVSDPPKCTICDNKLPE